MRRRVKEEREERRSCEDDRWMKEENKREKRIRNRERNISHSFCGKMKQRLNLIPGN